MKATNPGVVEAADPRREFEKAISQLQQEPHGAAQRPIASRASKATSDPLAEKRVLNDAARALARLWNLSPALIR